MVPGRAFLQRVYALTQKVQKHYHHVKITKEVRADLETWYQFLSEYNGRSFFLLDAVHTDRALQLYTDSSKTIRYGAVLGAEWLYGAWPDDWKAYDITFLELYPIVLSCILWKSCRTSLFNSGRQAVRRGSGEGGPNIGPVLLWIGQQTVQVPQFQDRRSF